MQLLQHTTLPPDLTWGADHVAMCAGDTEGDVRLDRNTRKALRLHNAIWKSDLSVGKNLTLSTRLPTRSPRHWMQEPKAELTYEL